MNNTITIIGSVHFETKAYKIDDLYLKLCEIKPDIILFEYPIEVEPEIMQWLNNFWEKRPGVENMAVLNYLKTNAIPVRPYDIRGRNNYFMKTKYFEYEKEFESAYSAYFKSGNVNPKALSYAKVMSQAWKSAGNPNKLSLQEINNLVFDTFMDANLKIQRASLRAIIDLVPEFASHKSGYLRREKYHLKRDKAMVANILNYNKRYDDKHLVVLCGYYHRFALVKMLSRKQKSDNFILKA
jgi:hypothetical protein